MLRFNRRLLALPVDAEGRIGYAVLEGIAAEFVVRERVAEPHIVRVAAADHHVSFSYCKGRRIELLPEAGDFDVFIEIVDTLLHTGKHLRGTHRHVIYGDVAVVR